MRKIVCLLLAATSLWSCSKKENPAPIPPDPGPIGGTWVFASAQTKIYDTVPGTGVLRMEESLTTTSNLKGNIKITRDTITSNGLQYDFATTGSWKDRNTGTGAETTGSLAPLNGPRGSAGSKHSSYYTFNTEAGELTINDAQYLFNPAFILLPVSRKCKYQLTGNTLRITLDYYDIATRHRSIQESSFQKQ